jgi:predicted permease
MQGRKTRPPTLASALLRVLLPEGIVRDTILGDLWEEHRERVLAGNRLRGWLWYWRQATGLGYRAALGRLSPRLPRQDTEQRNRLGVLTDHVVQDLRFAVRQISSRPVFTILLVVTLAIAIGPNVAIFSIFKAVVLEPLPYPEPDRLVHVWRTDIGERNRSGLTSPDYWDFREQSTSFEELGVYTPYVFNIGDGEPLLVSGVLCSASMMRALGVEPQIGRIYTDEEELDGSGRVVILSHQMWQERYGSDPNILGRRISLNGEGHEVVGVMPEDFVFLSVWSRGTSFQLWTPYPLQGYPGTLTRDNSARGGSWLLSVGRLRSGVRWRAAEQELRSIASRLAELYPEADARAQVWLQPFEIEVLGSATGRLLLLGSTVGFVLLIACANVASMLMARGAGRQTEVAVRLALGSARGRMIRQLLTENLLLAMLAGAVGVLMAVWSLNALKGLLPPDLPRVENVTIDASILAFAIGLSLFTALVFGLAPARSAARTNVVDALKEGAGTQSGAKKRNASLRRLTIAQLAIALMMTNGAVFLFESLQNVLTTEQVFDTEQVLTAHVMLAGGEYEEPARRIVFWEELVAKIEALPDVERAAVTAQLPLETGTYEFYLLEGEDFDPNGDRRITWRNFISPGYFEAMGIPLLAGRALTEQDGGELSIPDWRPELPTQEWNVVVNRAMAEHAWPGENPIGKRLYNIETPRRWVAEVVGLVEGIRQTGPERRSSPEIYWPFDANPFAGANLVVRSRVEPLSLVETTRAELARLDPDIPLSDIRTMETVLDNSMRSRYFITLLTGLFAALAVLLSMAGTYGIMSYNVAHRTHEIGVRVAMGARRLSLLALFLRQALRMLLFGIPIGLVLIVNGTFLARGLVYGVSPFDPLYMAISVAVVVGVALLSSLLPALRATRIDPITALRSE